MRRFKSILFAVGFIGLFAACNTVDTPEMKESSQALVINVKASLATKATTDVLPGEETIKDLQVYIFKKNGNAYELYRYIDTVLAAPSAQTSASWQIKGINANESYSVAVFANGLASSLKYPNFQNRDALRQQVVTLASSVPGTSGQFTMYGETAADVSVSPNETSQVNVTVQRFVSRVRLMSVQNKLPEAYGKLNIKRVFVINAYDTWNMYGTGTTLSTPAGISGRFNWGGETESHVIIASAGDCRRGDVAYGSQTFNALSAEINNYFVEKAVPGASEEQANANSTWTYSADHNVSFYVYPNAAPADPNSGSFAGSLANYAGNAALIPTRLVVYAQIYNNGQWMDNYYPVTVPAMERNKSYDINLLVTGFGSNHPNKEPEKGSMQLSVNVKPWDEGQTIPQEY